MALTGVPLAGATLTVMAVFNGRSAQLTTTGIGLFSCAERMASGVDNTPVGDAVTATPPTLVTVNCGNWPDVGIIMN